METAKRAPRGVQRKYLVGFAVVVATIGYLIFFGIQNAQQFYIEPSELLAKAAEAPERGYRVGGKLAPQSVSWTDNQTTIHFGITDGKTTVPVVYKGIVPDTFEQATEVVAEGKLNADGTFVASLVLAKCPSKYNAADIQWRSSTSYSADGAGQDKLALP